MNWVIILLTKGYKEVVHRCFFTGYYEDALNKGKALLNEHRNAQYFEVLNAKQYNINF